MTKMFKQKLLGALVAGVVATGSMSSAFASNIISFDPDGGGSLSAMDVGSFDFLPGNTLVVATSPTNGTLYMQTRLGSLLDINGDVIDTPGLNEIGQPGGFEITLVAQYEVTTTPLGGGYYAVSLPASSSQPNFLQMYFDDGSVASSDLAGTGFFNGSLIFDSSVGMFDGLYSVKGAAVVLDKYITNNYPSATTNTIGGFGESIADVSSVDASFFLDGNNLVQIDLYSLIAAAYKQVDPSALFDDGVVAGMTSGLNGAAGKVQLQNDGTGSFTVVPEPATLAMLAAGGLLIASRRRRA